MGVGEPSDERARDALRGYFAAIAALDPERIAACFAPDGELEDPRGMSVRHGRREITDYWAGGLCRLASTVEIEVIAALPAGGSIAAHWRMTAHGITGGMTTAEGIDVLHIEEDGLIRRAEGYWDQGAFRDALSTSSAPTSL